MSSESGKPSDPIVVDDSFDEPRNEFGLFQAYREGNLDLQVLSTQPNANTAPATTSDQATAARCSSSVPDPSSIPRSWSGATISGTGAAPDSSRTHLEKILSAPRSLSALFRPPATTQPSTATVVVGEPSSVTRAPYAAPVDGSPTGSTKPFRGNAILVNPRQRGNPLLKHIHHVAWEFAEIEPDYVVGRNSCVYFLSLRYHNLNSEYIFERLRQTKQNYQLSVLLTLVDVTDPHYPLKELCKLCLAEKLTLMLAWSSEEAARYLEAYKALENKPPDDLMPESASAADHVAQITDFLTSVRPVTKADAASAIAKFKNVTDMILAEEAQLEACPGFGQRKAQKLYEVFRMPFVRSND